MDKACVHIYDGNWNYLRWSELKTPEPMEDVDRLIHEREVGMQVAFEHQLPYSFLVFDWEPSITEQLFVQAIELVSMPPGIHDDLPF